MEERRLFLFDVFILCDLDPPVLYRGYIIGVDQADILGRVELWVEAKKSLHTSDFISAFTHGRWVGWNIAKDNLEILNGVEDIEEFLRLDNRNHPPRPVPACMQEFERQMQEFFGEGR